GEELRRNRRLARAGTSLQQEQPSARQAADGDIVQTLNAEGGLIVRLRHARLQLAGASNAAYGRIDPAGETPLCASRRRGEFSTELGGDVQTRGINHFPTAPQFSHMLVDAAAAAFLPRTQSRQSRHTP